MTWRKIAILAVAISLFAILSIGSDCASGDTEYWDPIDGIHYQKISDTEVMAKQVVDLDMTAIILPETVTYDDVTYTVVGLGSDFCSDVEVVSISIPKTVRSIASSALITSALTMITVDSENQRYSVLEGKALYDTHSASIVRYCSGLPNTKYEVPDNVQNISSYAFSCAENLVEISGLPEALKIVEDFAFYGCINLQKIDHNYDTGENTLPPTLIAIGFMAFGSCTNLSQLTLPDSLLIIRSYAFSENHGISSFHIPYELRTIEEGAFSGCYNLASFTVDEGHQVYRAISGVLFSKLPNVDELTLEVYPCNRPGSEYRFPKLVSNIAYGAFSNVLNLEAVIISDLCVSIPMGAFVSATSLKEVVLPSTLLMIDEWAFFFCENLSVVKGGESVVYIGSLAFAYTNVTSILPSSELEFIDEFAYSDCESLRVAEIPATVISLGSNVFAECINLERVVILGTATVLQPNALCVGNEDNPASITVTYNAGLNIPSDAYDEFTEITFEEIGKRPYPWVNLIGVAVCLLIVFGIFKLFREV